MHMGRHEFHRRPRRREQQLGEGFRGEARKFPGSAQGRLVPGSIERASLRAIIIGTQGRCVAPSIPVNIESLEGKGACFGGPEKERAVSLNYIATGPRKDALARSAFAELSWPPHIAGGTPQQGHLYRASLVG